MSFQRTCVTVLALLARSAQGYFADIPQILNPSGAYKCLGLGDGREQDCRGGLKLFSCSGGVAFNAGCAVLEDAAGFNAAAKMREELGRPLGVKDGCAQTFVCTPSQR